MTWSRRRSLLEELMVDVLRDSPKPMTLSEIVETIKKSNPSAIVGKTPTNSLYSIVYRNEKRRIERGIDQLFNKEYVGADCVYSLRSKPVSVKTKQQLSQEKD
jgi:hypothetical protein